MAVPVDVHLVEEQNQIGHPLLLIAAVGPADAAACAAAVVASDKVPDRRAELDGIAAAAQPVGLVSP